MLTFRRHNHTRFWAVWNDHELIAVVVYRRGAQALINFCTTGDAYKGPFPDIKPPRAGPKRKECSQCKTSIASS
jgi:hypothetical protein